MQRSILVPLDGSPLAETALPYASRLAKTLQARVVLFHARERQPADTGPDLSAHAYRLAGAGVPVEIREELVRDPGGAGPVIIEAASSINDGLIVMATHGRGGLGRLALGSTADQVVRQSTLPVLLVPNGSRATWLTDRPLRILVPLDGSERSERVIGTVTDVADGLPATLELVRVVQVPDRRMYNYSLVFLNLDPEAELATARAHLDEVATRLRARGLAVRTHALIGAPGYAVADVARDLDIDMIAMASQVRRGLDRHVMGSVTTATIRRARRPTLIVGPAARGGFARSHLDVNEAIKAESALV